MSTDEKSKETTTKPSWKDKFKINKIKLIEFLGCGTVMLMHALLCTNKIPLSVLFFAVSAIGSGLLMYIAFKKKIFGIAGLQTYFTVFSIFGVWSQLNK